MLFTSLYGGFLLISILTYVDVCNKTDLVMSSMTSPLIAVVKLPNLKTFAVNLIVANTLLIIFSENQ